MSLDTPENRQIFQLPIKIKEEHIDELGHVNNVVYVQWVQDAGAAHWSSFATEEMKASCLWVALRHEIDYLGQTFLDDDIIARTWVGDVSGAKFDRFVEIYRPTDDKVLAKAKTVWCLLDAQTRRPKRVNEEIVKVLSET
ncbi:MAG: thioesterase family protein [Bacteroidota bacterium]